MKKQIKQVALFNSIAPSQGPIEGTPDKKLLDLKANLIREEIEELITAMYNHDRVEMLDGLGDALFVLFGIATSFKLDENLPEALQRIIKSNMSKFCKTESEAKETVEHYKKNLNEDAYYVKNGEYFVVLRSSDNKVLKSKNYSRVNLLDLAN